MLQFGRTCAVVALHFAAAAVRRPAAPKAPPSQLQSAPLGNYRRKPAAAAAVRRPAAPEAPFAWLQSTPPMLLLLLLQSCWILYIVGHILRI